MRNDQARGGQRRTFVKPAPRTGLKVEPTGLRIGWLDSARMPSRIHRTTDRGVTTVCGHPCGEQFQSSAWVLDPEVPRTLRGTSRYCKFCFQDGGKTLPFLEAP